MWFYDLNNITAAGFEATHDYCCGVCSGLMNKVSWNSGPKTHDYWYCRSCRKEESEMQTRGKWIAKPLKEAQDGPDKYRTKDAGFFNNQAWNDLLDKAAKDKAKRQP